MYFLVLFAYQGFTKNQKNDGIPAMLQQHPHW
jgi:hypothetical protein